MKIGLALPAALALPGVASAASARIFNTATLAIHGYDPVGYFSDGKAVEGTDEYRLKWMGVIWRFASLDNLAAFESNPRGFAPQYGGYCAFAMAQGSIATSVPEAWTIYQDRLYLNYSKSVRRRWKKDIAGYVDAADTHWPGILDS